MLEGTIIRGDGIGRKLGFPTANIDITPEKVRFESGVYAALAYLGEQEYYAALVIMLDPWKVEAHLLNYEGEDIYGHALQIEPVQRVSALERYDTQEELKAKIARDIGMVRTVLEDQDKDGRDDHVL